jgi:hypothetical protein
MDEPLWSDDEEPCETEHSRILRVNRKKPLSIDLRALLDELRPVCRLDPERPQYYRNAGFLKNVLIEKVMKIE